MRAYFRVSPRFGVSLPWWIAVPLFVMWAELAMVFWLCVGVWMLGVGLFRLAWAGWRNHGVANS